MCSRVPAALQCVSASCFRLSIHMSMIFRLKGQSLPLVHIEAQADNTVREAKKSFCFELASFSSAKVSLSQLHSHDASQEPYA